MAKKERSEIPAEIAAKVLFLSDRRCCVCRVARKPVQIHHVDEDPNNSNEDNLAVLCLECHRDTQIRGGFDRKLDAHQIRLYRQDWHELVARSRQPQTNGSTNLPPGVVEILLGGTRVHLSYIKLSEKDDDNSYSFDADYPQLAPDGSPSISEINLCISAFVSRMLQRFRAEAIARSVEKKQMQGPAAWDDLSISHKIGTFNNDLLTVEFRLQSYAAQAFHPNLNTRTQNFVLQPTPTPIEFWDLFKDGDYLEFVSKFCITELHAQLPPAMKVQYEGEKDDWIRQGAGPRLSNFENFLLEKGGLRIFFDPYQTGSYAEGRREVFIPATAMADLLKESFVKLLTS